MKEGVETPVIGSFELHNSRPEASAVPTWMTYSQLNLASDEHHGSVSLSSVRPFD